MPRLLIAVHGRARVAAHAGQTRRRREHAARGAAAGRAGARIIAG